MKTVLAETVRGTRDIGVMENKTNENIKKEVVSLLRGLFGIFGFDKTYNKKNEEGYIDVWKNISCKLKQL